MKKADKKVKEYLKRAEIITPERCFWNSASTYYPSYYYHKHTGDIIEIAKMIQKEELKDK